MTKDNPTKDRRRLAPEDDGASSGGAPASEASASVADASTQDDALREAPALASLGTAMPGVMRRFRPGEHVYHQGEQETRLCLVASGWVALAVDIEGGDRCIVDFVLPGDMLGCILCAAWRTPHAAICVTEARLRIASRAEAGAAFARDPRLERYVARCRACSAFREQDHLANVVLRHAEARVAHMLLELCCRVLHGAPRRPAGGVAVPLGLGQMSAALGLTNVHLSRTLKRLREAGTVAIERRRITVLDPPRLVRLAGNFTPTLADPLPGWEG